MVGSDNLYKEFLFSLDAAVQLCELVWDDDGQPVDVVFLDVNPAYEKHTGLKKEDVVGRPIKEILPDVEQVWLDRYGELVQKNKPMHFEEYYTETNRWYKVNARPLGGNKFTAIFMDITENKNTKNLLQDTNKNYQALFDNKSFGIAHCKTIFNEDNQPIDYVILNVNDTYEKLTGLKREDLINKKITEAVPGVEQSLIDKHNQVAVTGEDTHFEIYEPNLEHWYDVTVYSPQKGYFIAIFTNITKTKKAEEALRESEMHYLELFNNPLTSFVIHKIITDRKGNPIDYSFIEANKAFEKQTGLKINDIIGKKVTEVLPGTEETGLIEKYGKVALKGESISFEQYFPPLDKYYQVEAFSSQKGQFSTFFTDITDRKKAEEALQESKERFQSIVETTYDVIYETDASGNLTYLSPRAGKLWGVKVEDVLGTNFFVSMESKLYSQGRSQQEILENLKALLSSPKAIEGLEVCFQNFEGKTIVTEVYASPFFGTSGELLGWRGVSRDITDRKKAEEALRKAKEKSELDKKRLDTILMTSPVAIIIVETDGTVSYVNDRARELYGIDITSLNLTDVVKKVKAKKIDGSEYPEGEYPTSRALQGQSVQNEEVIMEQPDGTKIPILASSVPIFNNENKIIGVISIFEDITKLKEAENKKQELLESEEQYRKELQTANIELTNIQDDLRKTIKKLGRSNAELEQFAYVASHDLQEPLRMVTSFTQLLENKYKDKLDADANDYIGFIVEGSHHMKDLIDDLLAFSRLNTKKKDFQLTDLNKVVDTVLSDLKSTIEEEHAHIAKDNLPILMCDQSQIHQVFQNLISNALKFHQTSPRIHITADENDKEYILGVKDDGIGIDPKHQHEIFDVFRRLHTREEYAGTGIGLSICKRIVERHNGRIWVESEPGKGATFYFTLLK